MSEAPRDQNFVPTALFESSSTPGLTLSGKINQSTGRVLVDAAGGNPGTVTAVSVVTANGFAGSVATSTSTPAITLSTTVTGILQGNGTAVSAITVGTGLSFVAGTLSAPVPTTAGLTVGTSLVASGTTTRVLYDNAGVLGEYVVSGSGNVAMTTSPSFTTPTLGAALATSINGLTITTSTGTLTITNGKTLAVSNSGTLAGGDAFVLAIAAGKTLTVSNSITLAGTDSTVMTFPTTSATIARTDTGQTFTGVQVMTSPSITTANLSGTQLLAENASIGLDPAGSADGKYTGITVTAVAGYTQAFGDLVYLDPTDSRWEATDANSAAGADGDARGLLGMVVVAGTDGSACTILLNGIIRADTKFPSFTVNNPIYVSETAGSVTQTQPSTTDVVIRIIGAALTGDEMYFNPDFAWITHT